jgi:4-amino-4-deoxy-L-arabinose transferase-like glycosyltransferase
MGELDTTKTTQRETIAQRFSHLILGWAHHRWILLSIFAVAIAVRLYRFGQVPPGLGQDEAATGYDAFALLHYGIDRSGYHNPVMFVSWGSGMYAIAGYLEMPFIAVLGLSPLSVRTAFLVLGVASLVLFYLLARRTGGTTVALMALFMLAIAPWHIMISRMAVDANVFPALFLAAVTCLTIGIERAWVRMVSAALFALCLFSYGTAYVVVPGFLVMACLYAMYYRKLTSAQLVLPVLVFAVIASPIVAYVAINQFGWDAVRTSLFSIPRLTGPPRYQTISAIFSANFARSILNNAKTAVKLFLTQDDGLIWNSIPGYGFFYLFSLPFIILGVVTSVVAVWRTKRYDPACFLVLWLLASVALALLEPVNINRINIIFLPLIYYLAVGLLYVSRRRIILTVIIACYGIAFVLFSYHYFVSYPRDAGEAFDASLREAIEKASEATDGEICVTGQVNQPYIFVLFQRKFDPHRYLSTVRFEDPKAEFHSVISFDRYTFGLEHCTGRPFGAYVVERGETLPPEARDFAVVTFDRYVVAIRPE